jgi:Photosynthetic reaction centre cytochrome C subunit
MQLHFRALSSRCVTLVLLVSAAAHAQLAAKPDTPKRAADSYKNLRVLGDVPASQWFQTMSFFADSLGVTCDYCHASKFESDEKPTKLRAREMISMTKQLNATYFDPKNAVNCNSCHRGLAQPTSSPEPNADHWIEASRAKVALPAASDLIARYKSLTGAGETISARAQRIAVDASVYRPDGSIATTHYDILYGSNDKQRVVSSTDGKKLTYVLGAESGAVNDGADWKEMTRGQFHSVGNEVVAVMPDAVDLSGPATTISRTRLDGADVYLVQTQGKSVRSWFFFDASSGLLLRHRSFLPSVFGEHVWDVDYTSYKRYGKFLLADKVRVVNAAGSGLTERVITSRKLNPKLDEQSFRLPKTTPAKAPGDM